MLFQEEEGGFITNLYNVKVFNKSRKDLDLTFKFEGSNGSIQMVGKENLTIDRGESNQQAFFVRIHRDELKTKKTAIRIGIYEDGKKVDEEETNFLGPTIN